VKVHDDLFRAGDERWVRMVVRAGSSVEVGRRGTRERTGYILVVVGEDVSVGGEFAGVSRCERCFDAASRYFEGE
jgi:hypothetical protein